MPGRLLRQEPQTRTGDEPAAGTPERLMGTQHLAALVALSLGLALAPVDAEARFGKRSEESSEKREKKKEKSKKQAKKQEPRQVHAASPAGGPRYVQVPSPPPRRHVHARPHVHPGSHVHSSTHVYVYDDRPYAAAPSRQVVRRSERRTWEGRTFLGSEAQVFAGGAALGARMHLEGRRLGFNAEVMAFGLAREDGRPGIDTLQTLDLHLTYAFISNPNARLRLHLGADSVFAEDITVLGPSAGASLSLDLVGPLGVDGSLMVTPFPYQQVDSQFGVTLALGPLGIRGGYRALWLDDAGLVDGVSHEETFVGPYLGLALIF